MVIEGATVCMLVYIMFEHRADLKSRMGVGNISLAVPRKNKNFARMDSLAHLIFRCFSIAPQNC